MVASLRTFAWFFSAFSWLWGVFARLIDEPSSSCGKWAAPGRCRCRSYGCLTEREAKRHFFEPCYSSPSSQDWSDSIGCCCWRKVFLVFFDAALQQWWIPIWMATCGAKRLWISHLYQKDAAGGRGVKTVTIIYSFACTKSWWNKCIRLNHVLSGYIKSSLRLQDKATEAFFSALHTKHKWSDEMHTRFRKYNSIEDSEMLVVAKSLQIRFVVVGRTLKPLQFLGTGPEIHLSNVGNADGSGCIASHFRYCWFRGCDPNKTCSGSDAFLEVAA